MRPFTNRAQAPHALHFKIGCANVNSCACMCRSTPHNFKGTASPLQQQTFDKHPCATSRVRSTRTMSSAAHSTQHSTTCAPVFRWALLVACMALLPLPPAIAELEEICSDIAEAFLEELAAEGPGISSAGCSASGADDFVVCGAEGSVGTCSDVFGCSTLSTIMLDACSEPGAVEACCVAFSGKPCSTCTETTQSCLQACVTPGDDYSPPLSASDDYSPPLTASEPPDTTPPSSSDLTDSECADFGEEVLEALAEELDYFTTSCSSAGTGEICDVLGSADRKSVV